MENVVERSKNLFVLIDTPAGDIFEMTAFEESRWLALIEAVQVIENGAVAMKVDLDKTDDWIQPIALEKYVRERAGDILHAQMNDQEYTKNLKCTSSAVNTSP